jgi:hypothetical protein
MIATSPVMPKPSKGRSLACHAEVKRRRVTRHLSLFDGNASDLDLLQKTFDRMK